MEAKKRVNQSRVILIALGILALIAVGSIIREYSKVSINKDVMSTEQPSKDSFEEQKETEGKPNVLQRIFGGGGGAGGGSSGGSSDSGSSGGSSSGTSSYTTDLTICTNAQNGNLCDGLDLAYGDGYKNACCSERSLCC